MIKNLKIPFNFIDIVYLFLLIIFLPLIVILLIVSSQWRWIIFYKLFCWQKQLADLAVKPSIILYGASLGETSILLRLAKQMRAHFDWRIVLLTTTKSAFQSLNAKIPVELNNDDLAAILPIDFKFFIHHLFQKTNPQLIITSESEFWPNLLIMAKQEGIKTISVNTRISHQTKQLIKFFSYPLLKSLHSIDYFYCANTVTIKNLKDLGVATSRIEEVNSFKFNPINPASNTKLQEQRAHLPTNTDFVFVSGSIQFMELPIILDAWQKFLVEYPQAMLIIIPRHPDKKSLYLKFFQKHGFSLLSNQKNYFSFQKNILLITAYGILTIWYQLSDCVFVGGSFNKRGGQNFIEPLLFKKPTAIGPFCKNFAHEKQLLLNLKGITEVHSAGQLYNFIKSCQLEPKKFAQQAATAYGYISQNFVNYAYIATSIKNKLTK